MKNSLAAISPEPVRIYPSAQSHLSLARGLSFTDTLRRRKVAIRRGKIRVLQINIGKKCDLACHHCHVEAGPKRTENMEEATIARVLQLLEASPDIEILDITGGAPELNPHFRSLAQAARAMGKTVYDRCNLTVFYQPGQQDTPQFLADNGIVVIASLPCYSPENVDEQRGKGVFDKSIQALQTLNSLGYGKPGSDLVLNLVYNPVGAHLPPPTAPLEADYRQRLHDHLGITFNNLFTITNMPIKRYLHYLQRENMLENYMQLLVENFNPQAAAAVMCTEMLSVSWDGKLYDCDFNQMLEIPLNHKPRTLWDITSTADIPAGIAFDNHCYGCTAGAGSSCGGALVEE